MFKQKRLRAASLCAATILAAGLAMPAYAEDTVKIGLVTPLTGPFTSTGEEMLAGIKLYMAQHGDTVAGKKLQLIVKDDGGVPDVSKRLAQELVINDHVSIIQGGGLTPLALAVAPIATQAKVPEIVETAATSSITEASPYITRTSEALPQTVAPFGEWLLKNGVKKVVTIVSDYGPGYDAEKWLKEPYEKAGGQVLASLRVPLANPDFAPFLQRAADAKPDAIFIFVPAGVGSIFMKQFIERGLDKQGIKLVGTGDVVDDDILNSMGDVALGVVTAQHYSAAHDSALNRQFVADFEKANNGRRPNFVAVAGYDGMALIYKALEKTGGDANGTKLIDAMKGMAWESPRGPISIDPATRDIIQNDYIRRVEKVNGQLYNVEIDTIPNVKDPAKAGK
jgi:branched-chain amino acid transport system substrate-binding protein